jgi:hypothetical protein
VQRRNFIVNFIIWVLSFFFGYHVGNAKETQTSNNNKEITNAEKITVLNEQLADMAISLKNYSDLKVTIAKGYDWSPAIEAARNQAKALGVKLRIPAGTYYISKSIDISGIAIEGDEPSVFHTESMGTWIICLNKDFSAFKQGSTSIKDITYSVKNLTIKDALIGLETSYSVNSTFKNVHFESCDLAIKHGNENDFGSLFNTFENIYTKECKVGIEINGKSWTNNNVFINCFFSGTSYAASLDCKGGIGAINNHFISCEFRSSLGYGIKLGTVKATKFNSCYFETNAAAIIIAKQQEATTVTGGVFGLLRNDNSLGHKAFIVADSSARGSIFIDAPYVYLPKKSENNREVTANLSFIDVSAASGMSKRVNWMNEPLVEGAPTNFTPMKGVSNYNSKSSTEYKVESNNAPHIIMKNNDESHGFDIFRNRENGGPGYGVSAKLNNKNIFTFDENGYLIVDKSIGMKPISQKGVPNNSLFVDSETNKLMFKDSKGIVKVVTLN